MRLSLLAVSLIAASAGAAVPTDWQDRGPGIAGERRGETVSYRADNFDAIAFGLPGEVEVRVGPGGSVRATGPARAFDNVRVALREGRLEIGHRYNGRDNDDAAERQLRFTVTVPRLTSAALGGSGRMAIDHVRGPALSLAVGGSGNLALDQLAVERATVSIGGSGNVTTRGTANSLTVNVGGSGSLRAPGLRANGAHVSVAGSGTVEATVDGPASVSTVGSGRVDLGAHARCTVTRMGHAAVRCGG